MKNSDAFPKRLKELRAEKKYTQKELADKLGIVRTAVANYETGRALPDPIVLSKLSSIFGVTSDYLMGHSDLINEVNLTELREDFPDGVDVLMRAKDELTPAQKKKMVELMNWFLTNIDED